MKKRQEGHEEDDDLGIEQVHPEAGRNVGKRGALRDLDLLNGNARTKADRLHRKPQKIGGTTGLEDGEGGGRSGDQRRNAEGDEKRMHDDAEAGAEHHEECRLLALSQSPADRKRHVRAGRRRQKQRCGGEGGEGRQARNEVHRQSPRGKIAPSNATPSLLPADSRHGAF
ncbi:hypothetical protein N183_13130 [Sinorhizobium sp. Sb3]|nr:hypothetical protein N183_13130 [Sinorhizobium sp. Sb3]